MPAEYRPLLLGLSVALALTVIFLFTIPICITFDGFLYIDLADVIGSPRFPKDWYFMRTPLYPLAIKGATAVLGRNALACTALGALLGFATICAVAFGSARTAGLTVAAIVAVLLATNSTLVAYQHLVLTETGSGFFLAALAAALLFRPKTERALWTQAIALALVLAAGYYWRQTLLYLAPVAAVLFVVGAWQMLGTGRRKILLAQVGTILVLPWLGSLACRGFVDDASSRELYLRQGIVRHALVPPDHPIIGAHRAYYEQGLKDSICYGMMNSGLRETPYHGMLERVFPLSPPRSWTGLFTEMVRTYPGRYAAGVGRTMLTFAGFSLCESETTRLRDYTFSGLEGKTRGGPAPMGEAIHRDFAQRVPDTPAGQLISAMNGFSDGFLIYATVMTVVGFVAAALTRNFGLFVMCALPLAYQLAHAAILASVDRYGVPAYPLILANGILVPVVLLHWWRLRSTLKPIGPKE